MKKTVTSLVALSLVMSGCSDLITVKREVDKDTATTEKRLDQSLAKMPVNQAEAGRLLYTSLVPGSWLGASKIKDAEREDLPDIFSKDITLVFPDRANLSTIAERLTKVTGIPVKLRPDVFIKASALQPKGAGSVVGSADSQKSSGNVASNTGIVGSTTTSSDYSLDSTLNYTGNLRSLLDTLCAKTGINWEFKSGNIVFYRLITKTFTLKSTPGSSQLSTTVGKSGGTQTGTASASGSGGGGGGTSNGSFASDSSVKMGSSFSVWENLKESINAMLTPVGKAAVTEATGMITVTDTREVVDQIGSMVTQINKSLSRQVSFRVEVLSLETTKGADYGIDWSVVFNKLVSNNPAYKLALGSPTSLTSSNAGSLTYSILAPTGSTNNMSQLTTSQAMLSAMNSLGKATVVTTASALTLNRQPVPVAITDQVGYVQSVSAQTNGTGLTSGTGSSGSNNPIVQINPGTVTTGFILNLLPSVTEDNSVLLQFSVDISSLKALPTFGQGALAVQTPEVTGMQFMQRVGLKNGQTLVLSGFERTSGQYDRRTMTEDADLIAGGSIAGRKKREAIVILITPVISEGA